MAETLALTESVHDSLILQSGSLTALIGIVIISLLLVHTVYHYIRVFHLSSGPITQTKSIYWLTIIYLLSGLMACSIYAFIRSNVFSFFYSNASSFSTTRCNVGYFGGYSVVNLNQILLYLVIIHRIRTSLKNSTYAYEPMLFTFLYWCMSLFTAICWIVLMRTQKFANWSLVTWTLPNQQQIIYCNRTRERVSFDLIAGSTVLAVTQIVMLFGLTYLFLRSLWRLRQKILELHAQSSINLQPLDSAQEQRLQRLDEIIKKQCILVCFAAQSTLVVWSLGLLSIDASTWICLHIWIHSICIWLMTQNAAPFWNCCKTYGVCCCCYWQTHEYDGQHIVKGKADAAKTQNEEKVTIAVQKQAQKRITDMDASESQETK